MEELLYYLQDLSCALPEGFIPSVSIYADGSGGFLMYSPEKEVVKILTFGSLEEGCERIVLFTSGLRLGLRIGEGKIVSDFVGITS
jgi:hypothetical protein